MRITKIVFNREKVYEVKLTKDIKCCLSISGSGRRMVQSNGIEVFDLNNVNMFLSCNGKLYKLTQKEELALQNLIAEGVKDHNRFIEQLQCPKKMAEVLPDVLNTIKGEEMSEEIKEELYKVEKVSQESMRAKEVTVEDLGELATRFVGIKATGAKTTFSLDKESGIACEINIDWFYTKLKVIVEDEGATDLAYSLSSETDVSFVLIDKETGRVGKRHYIPLPAIDDLVSLVVMESKFIKVNMETGEIKIKPKKFLKQLKKHLKRFIKVVALTSDVENLDDIEVE